MTSNIVPILNIVGITFDIVGAYLVATEVVRQFKGLPYRGRAGINFDNSFTVVPPPEKTDEFERWEALKYKRMKLGLGLLTLGFGLQILANFLQIRW